MGVGDGGSAVSWATFMAVKLRIAGVVGVGVREGVAVLVAVAVGEGVAELVAVGVTEGIVVLVAAGVREGKLVAASVAVGGMVGLEAGEAMGAKVVGLDGRKGVAEAVRWETAGGCEAPGPPGFGENRLQARNTSMPARVIKILRGLLIFLLNLPLPYLVQPFNVRSGIQDQKLCLRSEIYRFDNWNEPEPNHYQTNHL